MSARVRGIFSLLPTIARQRGTFPIAFADIGALCQEYANISKVVTITSDELPLRTGRWGCRLSVKTYQDEGTWARRAYDRSTYGYYISITDVVAMAQLSGPCCTIATHSRSSRIDSWDLSLSPSKQISTDHVLSSSALGGPQRAWLMTSTRSCTTSRYYATCSTSAGKYSTYETACCDDCLASKKQLLLSTTAKHLKQNTACLSLSSHPHHQTEPRVGCVAYPFALPLPPPPISSLPR